MTTETVIHRMSILKTVFSYFWMFWGYLFLWQLGTILLLGGGHYLYEAIVSEDIAKQQVATSNVIYYLLLIISAVGFVLFFIFYAIKKQKRYEGLVTELITEEGEGELNTVYWHFIILHLNQEKGNKKLRFDPVSFGKMRVGMRIKLLYDEAIADARKITEIRGKKASA